MAWRKRSRVAVILVAVLVASVAASYPGGATAAQTEGDSQRVPATNARIEGRVVDEDGRPIEDVSVHTVSTYRIPVGMEAVTKTRRDGSFVLADLGPSTYRILFGEDDSNNPVVREYWPDAANYADAVDIVVRESQVVAGVDAVLTRAARIRGEFGDGIDDQDEYVYAHRWAGGAWRPFRGEHQDVAPGTYEISGLPAGLYRVMGAESGPWHSVQGPDTGPTIQVAEGQTVVGPHVRFQQGGSVFGHVTMQGESTEDVTVTLYRRWAGRWVAHDEERSSAEYGYSFWFVRPGSYRLGFEAEGHKPEFWPNADELSSARDIVVPAGTEVDGFDAALEQLSPGVTLSGRLRYPDGSPVVGARASAYRRAFDGSWEFIAGDGTDGSGSYLIDELQPGTYRLGFVGTDEEMIGTAFWGGTRELETGRDIVIPSAAQDVALPDAEVSPGGRLSGCVISDYHGQPLGSKVVTAYRRVEGSWSRAGWDHVSSSGDYSIYGLPAGTYLVGVHDPSQEYAPELYPGARSLAQAELLTIAPQQELVAHFSLAWGVRNLKRPTVRGESRVDGRLRVHARVWSPYRPGLEFRWFANGKPIRGAHGGTYRPRPRDVGKRITVRVTGTYPDYLPLTVTTAPTDRVRR
jgi:hypothetical protein